MNRRGAIAAVLFGVPLAILLGVIAGLRRDGPSSPLVGSSAMITGTCPIIVALKSTFLRVPNDICSKRLSPVSLVSSRATLR